MAPTSEMQRIRETLPQVGELTWIGLAPAAGAPLAVVDEALVEEGTGLAGEHHARRGGGDRQVTLVQKEHLDAVAAILKQDVSPSDTRRNLVVAGINLLALKKARFLVGDVLLEGTGPCEPCSLMERNLGPGGYNAMRGHGGICARVIRGGRVRRGDPVRLEPA